VISGKLKIFTEIKIPKPKKLRANARINAEK
jgi:hypothetical protein